MVVVAKQGIREDWIDGPARDPHRHTRNAANPGHRRASARRDQAVADPGEGPPVTILENTTLENTTRILPVAGSVSLPPPRSSGLTNGADSSTRRRLIRACS